MDLLADLAGQPSWNFRAKDMGLPLLHGSASACQYIWLPKSTVPPPGVLYHYLPRGLGPGPKPSDQIMFMPGRRSPHWSVCSTTGKLWAFANYCPELKSVSSVEHISHTRVLLLLQAAYMLPHHLEGSRAPTPKARNCVCVRQFVSLQARLTKN